ncbi:MAG: arginine--tRNA ligase [Patescibacteria group bacterium]|nr:arginine--tRNA ligase [Patescibacteria group bacterium]
MIKEKIRKKIELIIKKLINKKIDLDIQFPNNSNFGDYSTAIALKLTKIIKKNPLEIAQEIVKNFDKENDVFEKIEIIKPGFINFWLSKSYLANQIIFFAENNFNFPKYYLGKNKKIMIEFAHPNTHKLFHIGHLRNISIGESLVRIFESLDNKVIRANYQGDVGLHIAKCLYSVKNSINQIKNLKTLQEKIEFIGKMYSEGTKAYEENEKSKQEIIEINKQIYNQDKKIINLWKKTRKWSLDYFNKIYKRVYSYFNRFYFESEMAKRAIEISNQALKKNILEKSEKAIIFNGKKYNLDTRVFINSLGYPTYEGKELALAEKEFSEFGNLDKNIHIVTPEQTSFFKVTFKVEELINAKIKGKQYHLAYEWVNLKTGKMSSRQGNIIEANWLIDKIKEKIIKNFNCDEKTAEILAVASAKYSFLKNSPQTIINFDIDESIGINGNSAPYLIYTYVRCQSVLKKSNIKFTNKILDINNLENFELNLLRKIYQFSEIVLKSAENYSPNFIANYLYELASDYNLFYQKYPIIKTEEKTKKRRILITLAVANIIKKGLELLGIKTVEKM